MIHVHPVGHAVAHLAPVGDVAEDRLAAQAVELLDAVALDVGLARKAQLFLYLDLDGQTVRVPAALALDAVALHGLVARDQILESPRQHVVEAGPAVGRRRPLVEDERVVLRSLLDRPLERPRPAPEREHLLLQLRELYPGVYLIERHGPLPPHAKTPVPADGVASLHRRDGSPEKALAVPPRLPEASRLRTPSRVPKTPSRCNGRTRPVLLTPGRAHWRASFALGRRLGEDLRVGSRAGLPPPPARSDGGPRPYSFPSSPVKLFVTAYTGRVK